MLATGLVAASALIALFLGFGHLYLTYFTPSFQPRDPQLGQKLTEVPLVITRDRSFARANVGFHASHGFGLILLGAVYGYLALAQSAFFFQSHYLVAVGAVAWGCYLVLALRYWYVVPQLLAGLAFLCYAVGVATAYLG